MFCQQCGTEIPPGISTCPSCARQLTTSTSRKAIAQSSTSANRKRLIWIGGAAVLLLVVLYVASGGSGKLTQDKAAQTIFQWEIQTMPWVCRCAGPCTGSGGSPVSVSGVQELPQENVARAVLSFRNAPFNHNCPNEKIYSGPGEAVFNHYTDGRWVLMRLSTSEGINSIVYDNLNIPVK